MAMCKQAFDNLCRQRQPQPFQPFSQISEPYSSVKRKSGMEFHSASYEQQRPYVEPAAKRRQSAAEPKVAGRELAPKPSNGSPGPMGAVPGKVPKKRGRPSKADQERQRQEAIAKGGIMAPATAIPFSTASPKAHAEEYNINYPAPTPTAMTTGTFYDPTQLSPPDGDTSQSTPQSRDSPGKTKRKPAPKPKVGCC